MSYRTEDNSSELRILGDYFVKNNKNKGKLIINNKKCSIKDIVLFKNINKNKIYMILGKNIYNKSCMFKNCESLESTLIKIKKEKQKKTLII